MRWVILFLLSSVAYAQNSCDDGNACTKDTLLANGACLNEDIQGCCISPIDCTLMLGAKPPCLDITCVANACVYAEIQDCCTADAECEDGNSCTVDTCEILDATHSRCIHTNKTNCCTFHDDCANAQTALGCTDYFCVDGYCQYQWKTKFSESGNRFISCCIVTDNGEDDDFYCQRDAPLCTDYYCAPEGFGTTYGSCLPRDAHPPGTDPNIECCVTAADCPLKHPPEMYPKCVKKECRNNLCSYDETPECCTQDSHCARTSQDGCMVARCNTTSNKCYNEFIPPPLCCTCDEDCDTDGNTCTIDICHNKSRGNDESPFCKQTVTPDCCLEDDHCNDRNNCTIDVCTICDGSAVCLNMPKFPGCCEIDSNCNDGLYCTDDYCVNGACTYTKRQGCCDSPSDCDDGRACTTHYCNELHQCVLSEVLPPCCDDDNDCQQYSPTGSCKTSVCNKNTNQCVTTPIPDCCVNNNHTMCKDTDPCTDDICVGDNCYHRPRSMGCAQCCANNSMCDDGNSCTTDTCNLSTNTCTNTKINNCCSVNCNDNNPCTIDMCKSGNTCSYKTIPAPFCCRENSHCNDNDPCTTDTCNTSTNKCVYTRGTAPCCSSNKDCNDYDCCTVDTCNLSTKTCSNVRRPDCCTSSNDCRDNRTCTDDYCSSRGVCVNQPRCGCCDFDSDCGVSNDPCTQIKCNAVTHRCEKKKIKDCCSKAKDCDDGRKCTIDSCVNGKCVHEGGDRCQCECNGDCNDNEYCTTDTCYMGFCKFTWKQNCCKNATQCNDNNTCTVDTCDTVNKKCRNKKIAGCCSSNDDCKDKDPCTRDTCTNNVCSNNRTAGCCAWDFQCKDNNKCTKDYCYAGVCRHDVYESRLGCCVNDSMCNDNNNCTTDKCNLNTNQCERVLRTDCCVDDSSCDDGDPCTLNVCTDQGCTFPPNPNCCDSCEDCDDGHLCTRDFCVNRVCVHVPLARCCEDNLQCNDGNPCTTDECVGTTCKFTAVSGCCRNNSQCASNKYCNPATHTCQTPPTTPPSPPTPYCQCDDDCDNGYDRDHYWSWCDLWQRKCYRIRRGGCWNDDGPGVVRCWKDSQCLDGNADSIDWCDWRTHTCRHKPRYPQPPPPTNSPPPPRTMPTYCDRTRDCWRYDDDDGVICWSGRCYLWNSPNSNPPPSPPSVEGKSCTCDNDCRDYNDDTWTWCDNDTKKCKSTTWYKQRPPSPTPAPGPSPSPTDNTYCNANWQCFDDDYKTQRWCQSSTHKCMTTYNADDDFTPEGHLKFCLSDKTCDDNNLCTTDKCVLFTCRRTPIANCCLKTSDCYDGDSCSTEQCVKNRCARTACPRGKHAAVQALVDVNECRGDYECDDTDACTADICFEGKCVPEQVCHDCQSCKCAAPWHDPALPVMTNWTVASRVELTDLDRHHARILFHIFCPHHNEPDADCPIPTMLSVSMCSCNDVEMVLDLQENTKLLKTKDPHSNILQFRVLDQHHISMHAELRIDAKKNLRIAKQEGSFVLKFPNAVAVGKLTSLTTVSCGDVPQSSLDDGSDSITDAIIDEIIKS